MSQESAISENKRHVGDGRDFSVFAVKAVGVTICEVVRNPCTELLEQMSSF